jgi:APA family basic amino acid/polyamine antiporter
MHSGIIAAIAFIFGRYVASFFPGANDQSVKAIAIAGILLLSAVNTFGVKHGARVQTLFTAGKLLAVGAMIVVGFALGERVEEHFVVGADFAANVGWKGFLLAVGAGLFAFGGWHMVAYNSEETINPRRTIPLALLIGVAVVTFCYIALNAVYMYILPLEAIAATDRIAADAAEALIGPAGGAAMAGLVAFSAYGALNGIILAGPRVYYAMARDGLAFKFMGAIHPKFRTPYWALLLQAAWSSVLVWTLAYRQLFTRVVYTEWIFFAMMAVGLFVFRRRKLWRDYSMWGYPVTPIVFIVAALAIVANQILSEPRECAEGLGLVIVGLPVYYVWIFWKGRNQPKGARG